MTNRLSSVESDCLKDRYEVFFEHLLEIGYSKRTIYNFKWVIRHLKQFLLDKNIDYSKVAAESFLTNASKTYTHSTLATIKSVLCRLDAFTKGESLASRDKLVKEECPEQFDAIFTQFLEHLKSCGFRNRTIVDYKHNILKVLKKFDESNIKTIDLITPESIYSLFKIKNRKRSFCSTLRQFLRYLFKNKFIEDDYSFFVPSVRYSRPVPSVYTKNETKQLLNSIDLNTETGKRNYAIILLALRLGIRTGDIVNLKFNDVDFNNKEINFIQEKNQIPQRLELLPEIENALSSYIAMARPDSNIPNIFLTCLAPIRALTPSSIRASISQHIKNAGINIGKRKSGAHSLRMTLASELVAEKVPYDVVRKILGHEDPVTIKHYVKFDIDNLRSCAIEVPRLTGKLAEYINSRIGGTLNEIYL